MKIDISVIYTIFNIEIKNEYLTSLKSTLSQKNVNTEIIVVEQNQKESILLKNFCLKNEIKYLFVPSNNHPNNIGFLKNVAIVNACGEYLYFNDFDVVFIQDNYLSKLVKYMDKFKFENLVRPRMIRLLDNHADFCEQFPKVCYKNLHKCFATFNNGKVNCNQNESYALINNLMHVRIGENKNQNFAENEIEDFCWQLNFHCGGLICNSSLVQKIGGFSLCYDKWGMEDIDFQWRLNEFYGTRYINDCIKDAIVLHLEHPTRAENESYKKNRNTFSKRRKNGLVNSIKKDIISFNKIKGYYYENK